MRTIITVDNINPINIYNDTIKIYCESTGKTILIPKFKNYSISFSFKIKKDLIDIKELTGLEIKQLGIRYKASLEDSFFENMTIDVIEELDNFYVVSVFNYR